ncbi:MAG: hypothetical protein ACYC27_09835 [Armatimonadota bacterium]
MIEPQPQRPVRSDTDTIVLWGFILSGLSYLCCCCCVSYPFALAGLVLGIIAHSRGDKRGIWIIVLSVTSLVLGGALNFTGGDEQLRQMVPDQLQGPWHNI